MKQVTGAIVAAGLALAAPAALADEAATPQAVIAKVKEAAAYLAKEGKAGLATFDSAGSPFVWKDSYVFVWDCADDTVVAHPVAAGRGLSISELKDQTGKALGAPMCAAADRPGGGWVEYMWPKPVAKEGTDDLAYAGDPARKVTYMLEVVGQPYQVGAGIYDDLLTIDQLNKLTD